MNDKDDRLYQQDTIRDIAALKAQREDAERRLERVENKVDDLSGSLKEGFAEIKTQLSQQAKARDWQSSTISTVIATVVSAFIIWVSSAFKSH